MNNNKFIWGVSSAAFQIEGAYNEDGKGLSIWDIMTHTKGKTKNGDTGDITCDHYHKYKEDVKLMAELGVTAYRFSISWSRVIPDGLGRVNEKGVKFYDNLIDELKKYGIEPYVTLYHWDLPQTLYEKGGFLSDDFSEWFYQYAKLIGNRFGQKVKYFITINEPSNIIEGLTDNGGNAPGVAYSLQDRLIAVHNILKAHGKAVRALRETVKDAKIGFAPCSLIPCPIDKASIETAREKYFSFNTENFRENVTLFSDPVFLGDYPKEYYKAFENYVPKITKEDLELISTPIDFCFHNIYSGEIIDKSGTVCNVVSPKNMLGWDIIPQSMYWGTKFLYERYRKPVYITENGMPCPDYVDEDGKVHDNARIEFIKNYTDELLRAKSDGIDVRGYFYWSIMDNLEWELGFGPRFGLIHVDFETLKRTPKDSFFFYKNLIKKDK